MKTTDEKIQRAVAIIKRYEYVSERIDALERAHYKVRDRRLWVGGIGSVKKRGGEVRIMVGYHIKRGNYGPCVIIDNDGLGTYHFVSHS